MNAWGRPPGSLSRKAGQVLEPRHLITVDSQGRKRRGREMAARAACGFSQDAGEDCGLGVGFIQGMCQTRAPWTPALVGP